MARPARGASCIDWGTFRRQCCESPNFESWRRCVLHRGRIRLAHMRRRLRMCTAGRRMVPANPVSSRVRVRKRCHLASEPSSDEASSTSTTESLRYHFSASVAPRLLDPAVQKGASSVPWQRRQLSVQPPPCTADLPSHPKIKSGRLSPDAVAPAKPRWASAAGGWSPDRIAAQRRTFSPRIGQTSGAAQPGRFFSSGI